MQEAASVSEEVSDCRVMIRGYLLKLLRVAPKFHKVAAGSFKKTKDLSIDVSCLNVFALAVNATTCRSSELDV